VQVFTAGKQVKFGLPLDFPQKIKFFFFILYYDKQMTIISQIITLLHVSYTPTCFVHSYMFRTLLHVSYNPTCFVQFYMFRTLLHVSYTPTCFVHSNMFRNYRVILRELVIDTLPSYTSISKAAVGNPIYN